MITVQPRDDYREIVELTIILFGECPPRGIRFNIKQLMVTAMKKDGQDNPMPRAQVDLTANEIINTKAVADFVTSASFRIFEAFNISMDFLDKDPSEWENSPSFQSSQKVTSGIANVNDFAERGVALI